MIGIASSGPNIRVNDTDFSEGRHGFQIVPKTDFPKTDALNKNQPNCDGGH